MAEIETGNSLFCDCTSTSPQSALSAKSLSIPVEQRSLKSHEENFFVHLARRIEMTMRINLKKHQALIILSIMTVLFTISITGFSLMWLTEVYNNFYTSKLVLANNSDAFNLWIKPPVNPRMKVHIFNYTNIDKFLQGLDRKIILKDIGPYTYEQYSSKTHIVFNDNKTITYKEHHSVKFLPNLSAGSLNDIIITPNLPLFTALGKVEKMNIFFKSFAEGFLSIKLEPFVKLSSNDYLWGYDNQLTKNFKILGLSFKPDKFGMLMNRNGTSQDTFQINTGEFDLKKLGILTQMNGMNKTDYWSSDECNAIGGTDGSQFPPYLLEKKSPLTVYLSVVCRQMPLQFEKEIVILEEFPALRYRTPMNVFSDSKENPDNECYCSSGLCPVKGLLNCTNCYNAPVFTSFPHFFSGDPILWSNFEGIEPVQELHQPYADIHPRLAFPINGASRVQINLEYKKKTLLKDKLKRLKNGIVLPLLWVEVTHGELSDSILRFIYHTTVTANLIQMILEYGTLLSCIASFTFLVGAIYFLFESNKSVV